MSYILIDSTRNQQALCRPLKLSSKQQIYSNHKMMRYYFKLSKILLLLLMFIVSKSSSSDNNNNGKVEAQISLTGGQLFYNQQTSSSSFSPSSSSLSKRDLNSGRQLEFSTTTTSSIINTKVCQVNGGESVAIVEIEESRGSDMSQSTNPVELPITGSVSRGEIELKIESETHKYFQIQDKKLKLVRPLDRDAVLKQNTTQLQIQQQPITSIYLQISCLDKRFMNQQERELGFKFNNNNKQVRKVIIPVLVKVLDINDNAPKFSAPIYTVQVDELAPIGTIVLDQIQAIDLDSANNGLIEYSLLDNAPTNTNRLVQRAQPYSLPPPTIVASNQQTHPDTSAATVSSPLPTTTTASSSQSSTSTTPTPASTSEAPLSSSIKPGNSRTPTINLNSEPIVNGPMEMEGDEEESDEALLASMNSTDIETESDTMMLMMPSTRARRKRSYAQPSHGYFGLRRFVAPLVVEEALPVLGGSSEAQESGNNNNNNNNNKANKDLWTDLMSIGNDADSITTTATLPHQQKQQQQVQNLQKQQQLVSTVNHQQQQFQMEQATEPQRASIEYFNLELTPHTNRPIIRLKRQLDYESKRTHTLTLLATDKATIKHQRLTSSATIVIKVLDGDDQGPAFVLEQSGCATGSIPPTTVSSLSVNLDRDLNQKLATSSRAPLNLAGSSFQRRQLDYSDDASSDLTLDTHLRRLNSADHQHHPNLPKGFKVTEENFDFSDTSPLNSGADEDSEEQDDPGSIVRLDPSLPLPPTIRSRRIPTSSTGEPAPRTKPPSSSSAIFKHHHYHSHHHQSEHYYSCLSALPVNSGQAEYFATVMSGESDYLLRVAPQAIKARDRDELNAPIRYSFINGTPTNYSLYFQINPLDASIKQVTPIERSQIGRVVLWVQAQEQTANALSSVAKLTIDVVPSDKNPPVLVPNSFVGFVDENSPIGSTVYIENGLLDFQTGSGNRSMRTGVPLQISVIDADQIPQTGSLSPLDMNQIRGSTTATSTTAATTGRHLYEFETTSDAFKVNKDGIVYVNKWPLDRDAPGQAVHLFQVTARQIGLASSRSISSPVSINVTLLDLNDNPPIIANSSLVTIQLPANTATKGPSARLITTIRALDPDEPQNARVRFSIYHVSNKGSGRFRLHEESGQLEALGKFQAGEQFSLTLQAQDDLGRTSQSILEVTVVPGPNSGGPQFLTPTEATSEPEPEVRQVNTNLQPTQRSSSAYSVIVNEGVAPNSAIFQLQATDPENDPITYSIVDGNVNNDFYINSKTGTIFVANKLDREEVSAYTLHVQARDSGGLAATKALHISITDNNDQNPIFSLTQYTFSIEEGVKDRVLGRVHASDGDAGENGRVSYYLEPPSPANQDVSGGGQTPSFSIDQQTGEIKLTSVLDYEQAKSHMLLITARDHGEEPRSATVSVLVRVIDVQDEAPYFERLNTEVRLQENLPSGHRVAQVKARDPDSVAQITYVLKMGDSNLFSIDPQSGLVTTLKALDYEEARTHFIIIGTSESPQEQPEELAKSIAHLEQSISSSNFSSSINGKSSICRIEISVLDTNDHAPQFVNPPLPVRVQDTTQLGTQVAKLNAQDLDGSEPNNQVRYELVQANNMEHSSSSPKQTVRSDTLTVYTSDRCAQSFMVDATSGAVSIKSDLRRDSQSECQLVIRAKDMASNGQESLSSTVQLIVYIDHIAEISSSSMIGFADTMFTIELEENSPTNTLVKVLPIVNKPKVIFPMSCEIVSGNELGKFYVMDNEQRDCELRTRDPVLDYEQKQRFTLTIRLNTIGSGSAKTMAQVQVNLLDKNDNRPVFQPAARYSHLTQNKFLAAISSDSPSETQVIQVRASDLDSPHSNGLISYELLNENELEGRFKVDPIDGIVRTSRPVEDLVGSGQVPLKLKVMARDNPEQPGNSLDSVAELVVNIIDDRHRIALALKDSPTGRVLECKEELLSALQERSGLISGLEKAESLKIQRNGSVEADVTGTDFWFYLIEPGTLRIVTNDDPRIKNALFESRSQNSLLDVIHQIGFQKARVRLPYAVSGSLAGRSAIESPSRSFSASGNNLASGLILIALFIAVTSAIVVVYQCGTWSSYSRNNTKEKLFLQQQQQQQQQSYYQCPNSFLGGALGPKSPGSLTGSPQDSYPFRSAFSTLVQQQQPSLLGGTQVGRQQVGNKQQAVGGGIEPIYQLEPVAAQNQQTNSLNANPNTNNKEYETQMLKMSVLFDDCNSINEQNSHENNISKNLNI